MGIAVGVIGYIRYVTPVVPALLLYLNQATLLNYIGFTLIAIIFVYSLLFYMQHKGLLIKVEQLSEERKHKILNNNA